MTTRAEKILEKILSNISSQYHEMVKSAFEEGYKAGKYQPTVEEALEECKKWQMSDEELNRLLR